MVGMAEEVRQLAMARGIPFGIPPPKKKQPIMEGIFIYHIS